MFCCFVMILKQACLAPFLKKELRFERGQRIDVVMFSAQEPSELAIETSPDVSPMVADVPYSDHISVYSNYSIESRWHPFVSILYIMYCTNNHPTVDGLIGLVLLICFPWTADVWALRLAEVSTQKRLQNWGPCLKRCRGKVEPLSCHDVGNNLHWKLNIKFGMQKEPISKIDVMWASFDSFLGVRYFWPASISGFYRSLWVKGTASIIHAASLSGHSGW